LPVAQAAMLQSVTASVTTAWRWREAIPRSIVEI
jgi:hypothetical protein